MAAALPRRMLQRGKAELTRIRWERTNGIAPSTALASDRCRLSRRDSAPARLAETEGWRVASACRGGFRSLVRRPSPPGAVGTPRAARAFRACGGMVALHAALPHGLRFAGILQGALGACGSGACAANVSGLPRFGRAARSAPTGPLHRRSLALSPGPRGSGACAANSSILRRFDRAARSAPTGRLHRRSVALSPRLRGSGACAARSSILRRFDRAARSAPTGRLHRRSVAVSPRPRGSGECAASSSILRRLDRAARSAPTRSPRRWGPRGRGGRAVAAKARCLTARRRHRHHRRHPTNRRRRCRTSCPAASRPRRSNG